MLIKPLTVAEVKGARATGKDYSLHDGFGLLLYVSKVGGKVWRFRYQHPDTKKRQTLTIGSYPEFTLAEAREERDNARRLVARGIDPNEEKRVKKNERIKRRNQSFGSIAAIWRNVNYSEGKRNKTVVSIDKLIENYAIPSIGSFSIHDITAELVISRIKYLEDRAVTLHKVISVIRNVMDFSVNTGIIESNPLSMIHKAFQAPKTTPQKALPIERLPEFVQVWEAVRVHPSVTNSVKFMMLTMARPGEAVGATWSEIDMDNKIWVIPAERMKMKKEHIVPLSKQAMRILEEMNKIKQGDFVFYSPKKQNASVDRTSARVAIKKNGFGDELTLHGFRSMWSTLLNEEGFNPDVIEAALAHKGGDAVRAIYNRSTYIEQRKIMMQWIGDFYDAARGGVIAKADGNRGLKVVNE